MNIKNYIKNSEDLNFQNLKKVVKEASKYNFVCGSDSTHSTSDYYIIRLIIAILLVTKYKFNIILIEAEWINVIKLNEYIHSKNKINVKELLKKVFSKKKFAFMWCNIYIEKLLLFLKQWNIKNKQNKVSIYGVDCQVNINPQHICKDKNNNTLNCTIITEIIKNYKIMNDPRYNYWNKREYTWLFIIKQIKKKYTNSKIYLLAHNSHCGNSAANFNRNPDHINIGHLLVTNFYNPYIIGFSTNIGTVRASTNWQSKERIFKLNPVIKDSFENIFSKICKEINSNAIIYYCDKKLTDIKFFRYIGVIYNKNNELLSHYIKTNINREYNVIIYINRTNALEKCNNYISEANKKFTFKNFKYNSERILNKIKNNEFKNIN